jgi:hypothetical protein
MGWLFSTNWPTRASLREHLVNGNGVKTLKSCWVGNDLWAVQEGTRADGSVIRFVCLYLCRWHGKDLQGWGYKDVDETMGPCAMSCPVSYIELVEAHEREHGYETGQYALEWRKNVRMAAAAKKLVLTEGQKIKLHGNEYVVGERRRGGTYSVWQGTMRYNLPRRMFKHVVVL